MKDYKEALIKTALVCWGIGFVAGILVGLNILR